MLKCALKDSIRMTLSDNANTRKQE